MYGLASAILERTGLALAIVTVFPVEKLIEINSDGVAYYVIPGKVSDPVTDDSLHYWRRVIDDFDPDLVHLHGTEFSHGLGCLKARPDKVYVVSIQGLISICARYYLGAMTFWDVLKSGTLRDYARLNTLWQARNDFYRRGRTEVELLRAVGNVVGRTDWDKAHSFWVNPSRRYFYCGEALRAGFYSAEKWCVRSAVPNTIFLSQAIYPLKGMHMALRAVALLKTEFPDVQLRVAGSKPYGRGFRAWIRMSGYGRYLKQEIRRLRLERNVVFVGRLSESEMVREYSSARVFLCPSSIENSSNSVGEAQMIGVPVVASYVGGMQDMVEHGKSGFLYRYEEVEMMAKYIRDLFLDDVLCSSISNNAQVVANQRHCRVLVSSKMMEIYSELI